MKSSNIGGQAVIEGVMMKHEKEYSYYRFPFRERHPTHLGSETGKDDYDRGT